jgi:hypothetical protein
MPAEWSMLGDALAELVSELLEELSAMEDRRDHYRREKDDMAADRRALMGRLDQLASTLEASELVLDQAQADTVEDAIARGVPPSSFPRCPYVDAQDVRCNRHFAHDGAHAC